MNTKDDREQLYQGIFEAMSDGLLLTDVETGLVVAANPAASAMHGYGRQEFIGLHPTTLMHPDSQHLFTDYIQTAQSGDTFQAEAVHLRRDGTPFHIEIRGVAFLYRQRPCLLSVIRDISERVRRSQQRQQQMMAQTHEQVAQAAMQERQRLAQNLHDAVNQSLFSASLIAEVLPRLWEQNPAEGRQSLEDLRRLTRGAMAEMRGLLAELRPLVLTDSDLGDLLRQLGDALTGRTNIPVKVVVTGQETSPGQSALPQGALLQDPLPADVQVAFYRVCQESLNNIAKHARASQVEIVLDYGARKVALQVCDNGRGFDPAYIPAGHYGLSIMRERAKAIGAELSVASQPGQGAEIVIRWNNQKEESPLNEGHT